MELFNIFHLMYWGLLALVIWLEAATFGVLWQRQEAARWTMGYFTVFTLGVPLVILGIWDAQTWLGLFFGVGVSGAVKVGFDQWRKSRLARELRNGPSINSGQGGTADGWQTPWQRR